MSGRKSSEASQFGAVSGRGEGSELSRRSRGFEADRLAERWCNGEPVSETPADVRETIESFSPSSVPPEIWKGIESLVRGLVEQMAPSTIRDAKTHLNAATQIAFWAAQRGQPLDPETLLHPTTIDRFIVEGCGHLKTGTQTTYRSQLREIGRVVVGPALYPVQTLIVPRLDPRTPYTEWEVNDLAAWTAALPTELQRTNMRVLLVLCLGAGLTAQEVKRIVGSDVTEDAEGVLVSVIGKRSRTVPVLRRWEKEVARVAREAGDRPMFRTGRTEIKKFDTSNFIERCTKGSSVSFQLQRLRATWIVGQIEVGTPLLSVAEAAGVGLAQIARYLPMAKVADPAEIRQKLRCAGGVE